MNNKHEGVSSNENIKEDMSLADIYHDKEENDFSKKIERKIGF